MSSFENIINEYIKYVTVRNDKRIMQEALNLLESEEVILDNELDVLNELFHYLKMDYTIKIIKDKKTLEFCIAVIKQEHPIIENKHDVNILIHELNYNCNNRKKTKMEETILNFLNASEHIEENEVLYIQNIIQYLNNNWILKPMEEIEYQNQNIMCSKIIPSYNKYLIKK